MDTLYSQCRYLLKKLDHCVARIALSWNGNVSLAYHIAFAGERDKAESSAILQNNAIRFVSKLIIFQKVEILTLKLIFYYAVLGLFYLSRVFMHINTRMSCDWMHFACFSFVVACLM